MNAIIVDDEPLARKGIQLLTDKLSALTIIHELPSAIEATNYLATHEDVDIIFLDIEMPGLNGLDFLKSVPTDAQVILTTAYPQYALEAFELDVVDYLLKPIKFDRFYKAVKKCEDIIQLQGAKSEVEEVGAEFFYIKSDRKYIRLFFEDITHIKGLKDYVMIHTTSDKYMTAMNVGTVHKQLPPDQFARVSKSYIINVKRITQIDTDFIYLGDLDIPLGQSYKEEFIKNYVQSNFIGR